MKSAVRFEVIVVGSSMGGIAALQQIIESFPADLSLPVVIVQHLSTSIESNLVDILRARTHLRVEWATDHGVLRAGTVYVAPPCHTTQVMPGGLLGVKPTPRSPLGTPPVDPLFKSVAIHYKSRALAVVLTGALWDGAQGVAALKRHGSTILIQDPTTAFAPGMPEAASRTNGLHFVLPLNKIGFALTTLVTVPDVLPLLSQWNCPLRYWLQCSDNAAR